ncbi:anaphase promoting complex subunit 5 NDAI_0E01100 [Naumovozyma dairenensis CBS 421]|uniref:Anaphase-promoting complex subunit 5 n=1 Tax=Naumovozyma dairenensis (strain ATCC 10597 / BCRC 20456 / CBS 421 / NBRC 0211 / NRRL Y-12639) TaxID=1071378 RepID=G0WB06_NAUDC|nr:hypothetical protein NDAI_0E01100 [Naumovozyma dairenensis CBS 421]CCD24926.1 hypothetical protein NDAI_0E01100 [Naumovozyma dairenensis CBS 421]
MGLGLPEQTGFEIVSNVNTYEVAILVLIYIYCYEDDIPFKPDLFFDLISPTIHSPEFNPYLDSDRRLLKEVPIPIFEDVSKCVQKHCGRQAVVELLGYLYAIKDLDTITQLIRTLYNKNIVEKYTDLNKREDKAFKCVTRKSFLGRFMERCYKKFHVADFEENTRLWDDFKTVNESFRCSFLRRRRIDGDFPRRNFRHLNDVNDIMNNNSYDSIISIFDVMENTIDAIKSGCERTICISPEHFQNLINWRIYENYKIENSSRPNVSSSSSRIDDFLNNVSLNDMTKFPSLHILRYLKYVSNLYYKDALDSLHKYFDYMLSQNSNNYFHLSLLCLATFYSSFHDCEAAMKAFEEATKVARENKDTTTLNLIMIWMVNFIEEYPQYSKRFQVTIDQIVKYMRRNSDNENVTVFENAYRFESLLLIMNNSNVIDILESSFKYMTIVLQHPRAESTLLNMIRYRRNLWNTLGYTNVAKMYQTFLKEQYDETDTLQDMYVNGLEQIHEGNFNDFLHISDRLKNPTLTYQESMVLKDLEIKYLVAIQDYHLAMDKLNIRKDECTSLFFDKRWEFEFDIEKCDLLIESTNGIRCLPNLLKLLDSSSVSRNQFQAMECLILLSELLLQLGKKDEAQMLMNSNMVKVLQFPSIKERAFSILNA